jgi:hypothetical protein
MVAIVRTSSRGRWGALVLLAQLLAFGILPTLHLQLPGVHEHGVAASHPSVAVHPGSDQQHDHRRHDESTCQFCRLADSRFASVPAADPVPPAGAATRPAADAAPAWHAARPAVSVHSPRAPPAA